MRCYPRISALLHTQHSLTHRAAQTVGGSLSCSSYQGHGSGEKLQDPRRVNTFLWIKSIRKQCDQKNGEKMFSFYAIWFGLYRIYTFGVSYLFLMVVLHLGSMDVVCTSPLGGLACPRLQPAASERQWPFWRQSFLFLLSPHNKLVSSEEWPRHSDSHTHPGAGMGGDGLLPPDPQALLPLSHWKDAARRPLLLLLGASFPRCCSWETFWKLFGNKKQIDQTKNNQKHKNKPPGKGEQKKQRFRSQMTQMTKLSDRKYKISESRRGHMSTRTLVQWCSWQLYS